MKKWIIFDAMGVIFKVSDDTNDLLVPFVQERNKNISKEKIVDAYMDASLGKITSDEFWDIMELNTEGIYIEYLDTCLTIDENFIEVAKKLSTKYNLAILSNDVKEWSAYLRKKYNIDELIQLSVISGEVKCRKPDKKIYELAINKIGVKPENCVFIDDRDKNLVPAIEKGINVIKFLRDDNYTNLENVLAINNFYGLEEILDKIFIDF